MPPRSLALSLSLLVLPAVALRGASDATAPSNPSADSPFLPPADSAGARPDSAAEAYALIGMTVVGHDTLLSITRLSDKRSFWIPVGKTANGITVVSYDTRGDRAVIRADGQTLTLVLRKAETVAHPATAPAAAAPAVSGTAPITSTPTATPPGVVPNRPMTVQEEKEMEARMLVTDLLEIGQQQRKAYEEAQRQAAARAKSPPATPAADTPPPSPPAAPPKK